MSDYLAVGGVTAVLDLDADQRADQHAGRARVLTSSPAVTAVSPDMIEAGASEDPRLNLFMYYVSLNPALRNLGPAVDGRRRQPGQQPAARA